MPTKTKLLKQRLENKFQFRRAPHRSKDHEWFELQLEGLPLIATKISLGMDEIGVDLESKIARQLRVKKQFMVEMLECTKSCEEYIKQVRTTPVPPWDVHF